VVLGAATGVVVALAVGGWLWTSSSTADAVHVAWDDAAPTCTGTTVRSSPQHGAVVEAVDGMRCTYRINIRNDSGRTVHLVRVDAPGIGPQTGTVVVADPGATPAPVPAGDGFDAAYELDRDLGAGESASVDIVVVFHPQGCNDSGTFWEDSWPSVRFETLNRGYDRAATNTFAFRRQGRTPGCKVFD
jgi:hypothetical protein